MVTLILEDGPLAGKQVASSAVAAQCKFFITSKNGDHLYCLRRKLFAVLPGQTTHVHVATVYGYVKEGGIRK